MRCCGLGFVDEALLLFEYSFEVAGDDAGLLELGACRPEIKCHGSKLGRGADISGVLSVGRFRLGP